LTSIRALPSNRRTLAIRRLSINSAVQPLRRRRPSTNLAAPSCYNDPVADDKPAALNFEAALAELESVVKQLETGDLPLEESLRLFERGMDLSQLCRKQLDDAEHRVEILIRKGDKVQAEPLRTELS